MNKTKQNLPAGLPAYGGQAGKARLLRGIFR